MTFSFSIQTPSGPKSFHLEPATSLLFVGANGSGKTRLAVKIEEDLGEKSHRISAHRALNLNPSVPKIDERAALFGLRTGHPFAGTSAQMRGGGAGKVTPRFICLMTMTFCSRAVGRIWRSMIRRSPACAKCASSTRSAEDKGMERRAPALPLTAAQASGHPGPEPLQVNRAQSW